jgi:translation initiation factor eIF-2B subunit delta
MMLRERTSREICYQAGRNQWSVGVSYDHRLKRERRMQQGKDFTVMCVDARPNMTGERLTGTLLRAGVKCFYMALNAVSHMMRSVTKVLLGAAAVKSNGAVVARCGSAVVAMAAAGQRKPVLICAQSIKFHDEVQLESITSNEQGPKSPLHSRCSKAAAPQS